MKNTTRTSLLLLGALFLNALAGPGLAQGRRPSAVTLSRIAAAWGTASPLTLPPPPTAAPPAPGGPPSPPSSDQLFVFSSVGGGADPVWWFDAVHGATIWSAAEVATDNVNGAAYTRGGSELLVSGGLNLPGIMRADLSTVPPTWTSVHAAAAAGPFDVQADEEHGRLYAIAQSAASSFTELIAIDDDPASPTYEQVIASTSGLTLNAFTERFGLSATGRRAAVLSLLQRRLYVVDTDPASGAYMQVLHQAIVPAEGVFPVTTEAVVTPDDGMVLITIQAGGGGPSQIARFDLGSMSFVDHAPGVPGVQNIGPSSTPPASLGAAAFDLDVASDGAFAVACGWAGAGWAGRLDLDPALPGGWAWTSYNPAPGLADAWALDLGPRDRLLAIETTGQVLLLHPLEGVVLETLPVSLSSNVYTLRLR